VELNFGRRFSTNSHFSTYSWPTPSVFHRGANRPEVVIRIGPRCIQRPKLQPRTVRIRWTNTSGGLRCHTIESGEVGSSFSTVFQIGFSWLHVAFRSGPTRFFDEFRLFDRRLVDSKLFPPWRQQTGSGRAVPGVSNDCNLAYWALGLSQYVEKHGHHTRNSCPVFVKWMFQWNQFISVSKRDVKLNLHLSTFLLFGLYIVRTTCDIMQCDIHWNVRPREMCVACPTAFMNIVFRTVGANIRPCRLGLCSLKRTLVYLKHIVRLSLFAVSQVCCSSCFCLVSIHFCFIFSFSFNLQWKCSSAPVTSLCN